MNRTGISTHNFNTRFCLAKHRTDEVADCLSSTDVVIFCPFVVFFGQGTFCRHPQRNKIIERTEKLLKDIPDIQDPL